MTTFVVLLIGYSTYVTLQVIVLLLERREKRKCKHQWTYRSKDPFFFCIKCGLKRSRFYD